MINKKNKLMILILFVTGFFANIQGNTGQLTNNSNLPVNIVFYSNYTTPTDKYSPKGRINPQGTIIPPGQNTSFITGTTSIDIYYNTGMIHANVNSSNNYTIIPSSKINEAWTLTLD